MASTFASYFGLRSTVAYTSAGSAVPAGSLFTISSNVGPTWSNTLTVSSFSTLLGSTITVSTLRYQSTTISLGASTNQSYTNFTSGSYAGWGSTLSGLTAVQKIAMSYSGQYQYAAQNGAAATQMALSNNSGLSWQTLTSASNGLPAGSLAYQATPSGNPAYTSLAASATGQYALAAASGGQLYVSNNANSSTPVFTAANIGGQPFIYLPFENSAVDMLGNSALTLTGAPTYTTGKVGSNAINFANTAGGTATQYLRGTWAGATNFTVSFWFNTQSTGAQQNMFGTYNNIGVVIYITSGNQLRLYINNTDAVLGPTITSNTWYNVVAIFQANGTGSFYVNNVLYGTYACGASPGTSSGLFGLGTMDILTIFAFNGYIDDFRIYNFAAPNVVSPMIYLPLENSVTDVVGSSAPAVTGSVTYTTGVVGTYAAVISNTAAGTASNYIRGTMSNTTAFTISGWINLQSIPGSGLISAITVLGGAGNYVAVSYFNNYTMNSILYNGLMFFFYNTGSVPVVVGNFSNVSINTWYSFTYIFSATGTCSAYVNGTLVGSVAGQTLLGSLTTYSIGCGVTNTAQAFNGYIDDYRLYNSAVTYSPIVPMNWAYTAVSGSGQYMLATATGGGLFMSSNYGVTWSQVATSITNPLYTGLGISYSGQYMLAVGGSAVTPQQSGLAAASWTQGGVSWATSASSQYSTFAPQSAFNSSTATTWASNSGTYNGSGAWTGSVAAVTIQGVGSISGEWLQLQSNVGLLMQSYTFSCGGPVSQTPKTYYIIGSNDGSTWYPIQYVSMGSNPYTTNYSVASTYITTNQSGSQNLVVGANTAVLTCTTYSTTVNTYTYFRILVTTTHGGGVVEIGEWYINFANGQNYSTNYGSSWNRLSLNGATQTFGALSGNGQYALTGTGQIAYLVSNYLAGFSTNAYTTLTLSGINANIISADISATGQYMTIITQGTTNNVYYSTNYGVTFTALTVGSAAMTDCSISADGSYITVSNATTVYTLNLNTRGYGVSIGNAAGSVNQGQHAIAIGNSAGVTNQSAGSIVLNSSGSTLDTYNSGFYVSNISDYGTSYAPSFSLLGYGSDKQVVQGSVITLSPSGYIGIGTTAPSALLHVFGGNVTVNYGNMICLHASYPAGGSYSIGGAGNNFRIALNSDTGTPRLLDIGYYTGDLPTGAWNSKMVVNPISGNVGIGMTVPTNPLQVAGRAIFGYIPSSRAGIFIDNETAYGTTPCIQGVSSAFGTSPISINPAGGNVGINTTSPGYNLHVIGTIYASGDITALSDQRYKQNIIRLDRSLDKVLQLSGYSYTREDYRPGEKQIGLLAQEVLTIFPEAVSHDSTNDKYSLNYGCLIAPVVESIKELQDQITAQNQIIESQGKAIQLLLARLNVY